MDNNPNPPGSTSDRPDDEAPGAPDAPTSAGQPTERVTPSEAQSTMSADPSQLTMPQPETTIYTPQPGQDTGAAPGAGTTPPAYTQPMGAPPQQPYGSEQARAQQQGYPQQTPGQGQYPPSQYPPGQYPQQGQPHQGYPPPGQYPQGQYPPGQYPQQYQQGNVPPGQSVYPPPGYGQPVQPMPKRGGIPVIAWVLGGLVVLILAVCGIAALLVAQAVNNVTRSAGDVFATVEASVGGIPSWLFYNDLSSGDYDSARDYLSADLKRQYSADRLQEEWERLVDATGGITVGDYELVGSGDNAFWVQELEGANNHFYEIQVTVKTVGNDYVITDAKPSLIPKP